MRSHARQSVASASLTSACEGRNMSRNASDSAVHTHSNRAKARLYVSAVLAVLLISGGAWILFRGMKGSSPNARSAAPTPLAEAAPEFTLQTLDGQSVRLSDYRGQVVLLNTWATWCPPCRAEMPDLEAYYRQHGRDGFVVLAVNNQESPGTVAAFLGEHDFTFPILLDPEGVVIREYGVLGLPTSFFIDRDGTMRGVWSGQLTPARLKELVDPLL
jgi:cytochrome c biogenesis protein CcmG/thiol:disulfide interchange protein DsbE